MESLDTLSVAEKSRYQIVETKAYAPKVIIKNEIFPRPDEVYNCTSCRNSDPEHPAWKMKDPERYHVKCTGEGLFPGRMQTGPRWNDISCPKWSRKIPKYPKGYNPGIDTGPYDPLDKR